MINANRGVLAQSWSLAFFHSLILSSCYFFLQVNYINAVATIAAAALIRSCRIAAGPLKLWHLYGSVAIISDPSGK